jgi:hypothetical protein
MDCGVYWQPTVRVRRARVVVLPGWIASIVVGLFLIVQQLLLFLAGSCDSHGLAHAPVALASRTCRQSGWQCRANGLLKSDALTRGPHVRPKDVVHIRMSRRFVDGGVRRFARASEDAGSAKGRAGSEGLAVWERSHVDGNRRGRTSLGTPFSAQPLRARETMFAPTRRKKRICLVSPWQTGNGVNQGPLDEPECGTLGVRIQGSAGRL